MKTTRGILRALRSDGGNGIGLPYGPPPASEAQILDMHRQHVATELVKIGAEGLNSDRWAEMAEHAIDAAMVLYPEPDDSEKGAPD